MLKRLEIFELQNPEIDNFDVTFEIEGKKLYAHSFLLTSISTTFDSMLSNHCKKNIEIKIYSFKDFKEFIRFIYSGECKLTKSNICAMFDIAEFFNVEIFKNACDLFLYKENCINFKNVYFFLEISQKYSLIHLKTPVNNFIEYNLGEIIESNVFLKLSKSVVKKIVEISKQQRNCKKENIFEAVYLWAKKQAKMKIFKDETLNLKEIIKNNLSDLMPMFNFGKMDKSFIMDFLAPKSFLFTRSQLNAMISTACNKYDVKILDRNGNAMKGELHCEISDMIYKAIHSLDADERYARCIWIESNNNNENDKYEFEINYYYWPTNRQFPSYFPVNLEVNAKVPYYLIYDSEGDIAVKNREDLIEEDFLLAEMFREPKFRMSEKCKIEIYRSTF